MRVFSLCAGAATCAAAVALAATSCGDKVQSGLTGVDIQVTFESDLQIRRLRFAGFIGETPAFPPDDRPHVGEERELDPTDENLIVLLPDTMGTKSVFVRVDGVDELGAILASAGAAQVVEIDKILAIRVHLGEPRVCCDGAKHPTAEQCDDGNQLPGDGCSAECVIETGWTCEGSPSVCRSCGDGVCSVGEDECSCPEPECAGIGTCGDGLCCPSRDENVCSCPDDCLEEDAVTCPDSYCCPDERAAGNCEPDCGMCGDHVCEPDKGEDSCTCPGDCTDATSVCGNQNCCNLSDPGEDIVNCPQDCCPDIPTPDGVCCPVESAENAPGDCCATMAQCGDSECCPGEETQGCPECCANVCGDDDCCGSETVASCPQDCCPGCSDTGVVCPGCCADDCPGQGDCSFACDSACSCYFDCTDDTCGVTCTASSCYVECGTQSCQVTCQNGVTAGDGGVTRGAGGVDPAGACYCRGAGCALVCPSGVPQVDCGDGGIACGTSSCP
jgi:hypothetical protein